MLVSPGRRRRRRPLGFVTAGLAAALVFGACSSSSSSSAKTTTTKTKAATTTTGEKPAASCVADVPGVIARKPGAASTTASLPAALIAKLDAAAKSSFRQAAAPGAVVGVRTPTGTWISAYGVADHATKAPMTTDIHTRIGSVTKTFTGTLLLQLAEQGKLSLDDHIGKYIAGIPNGDVITLRMLANMTSGVASYTRSTKFTDEYFAHPETVFGPDQLISVGVGESPLFKPGAQFDYSNTNTVLLGKVIEKLTGKPIAQVMQDQILTPLRLTNTSWPGDSSALPAPYPQGYTLQGSGTAANPANATNWNPAWGWTAGELISTVNDLLRYGRALGTGQGLLSAAEQTVRLNSLPAPAGYGIALGCIDGWVGHTGELPGFNTSVFYDTTTDTTVITETNSDIASGACPESPVLNDNDESISCSAPATRMFVALSAALGHPFHANPLK